MLIYLYYCRSSPYYHDIPDIARALKRKYYRYRPRVIAINISFNMPYFQHMRYVNFRTLNKEPAIIVTNSRGTIIKTNCPDSNV